MSETPAGIRDQQGHLDSVDILNINSADWTVHQHLYAENTGPDLDFYLRHRIIVDINDLVQVLDDN